MELRLVIRSGLLLLASIPVPAASLDLRLLPVPSNHQVAVGSMAAVEVWAHKTQFCLDNPATGNCILGAYDFHVNYAPGLLGGVTVAFGTALGPDGFFVPIVDTSAAGTVRFGQISLLLDPAELLALQNHPFRLATINFQAIGAGIAPVALTRLDGADVFGNPMVFGTQTSTFFNISGAIDVPEPTPWLSLLSGLALVGWMRRRRRRSPG